MPSAVLFAELGLALIQTIVRQIQDAQRGVLTPDQLLLYHQRVLAFMQAVQADADTLREDPK